MLGLERNLRNVACLTENEKNRTNSGDVTLKSIVVW